MSDSKTIPAALEGMLRPRRMGRIHGTEAKSRAAGAMFDALLGSAFLLVAVVGIMIAMHLQDFEMLTRRGIDETWVVAGSMLVALFASAALWWRWFKWRVHAIGPDPQAATSPAKATH